MSAFAANPCAFRRHIVNGRYVGPDYSDFGGPEVGARLQKSDFWSVYAEWRHAAHAYREFYAVASSPKRLACAVEA